MVNPPLLFAFVAWMKNYQGNKNDPPRGGGSFPDEHGWCYEMFNFRPAQGKYFGWVETMRGGIRVHRLTPNAPTDADVVESVTVIFVARNPETDEAVIVGWYNDAQVYRHRDRSLSRWTYKGEGVLYNLVAPVNCSHLLPVAERRFAVPTRAEGGFGQSRLWYADQPQHRTFIRRVRNYLLTRKPPPYKQAEGANRGWLQDIELRQEIERIAVDTVWKHFKGLGFALHSREKDCVGWDLEATKGRNKLLLEVKGSSSDITGVSEVTANEYAAMTSDRHRAKYRLCIVSGTLAAKKRRIRIYFWSTEQRCWTDADSGLPLAIEERVAARVRWH